MVQKNLSSNFLWKKERKEKLDQLSRFPSKSFVDRWQRIPLTAQPLHWHNHHFNCVLLAPFLFLLFWEIQHFPLLPFLNWAILIFRFFQASAHSSFYFFFIYLLYVFKSEYSSFCPFLIYCYYYLFYFARPFLHHLNKTILLYICCNISFSHFQAASCKKGKFSLNLTTLQLQSNSILH